MFLKTLFGRKKDPEETQENKIPYERFDDDNSFMASELLEQARTRTQKPPIEKSFSFSSFKKFVQEETKLSEKTVSAYCSAVFTALEKEDLSKHIQSKTQKPALSQLKRGFELLAKYDTDFSFDVDALKEATKKATRRNKNKRTETRLADVERKINALRDKKLKVAYRLMTVSGLRGFEIAKLTKENIKLCNDGESVVLDFVGKFDKERCLQTLPDKYVHSELKKLIENTEDDKNIFYSSSKMQKDAKRLDFKCHALRAAFAQIIYNNSYSNKEEAIELVKNFLGHGENNSWKKYLSRKINFSGTRWDNFNS